MMLITGYATNAITVTPTVEKAMVNTDGQIIENTDGQTLENT